MHRFKINLWETAISCVKNQRNDPLFPPWTLCHAHTVINEIIHINTSVSSLITNSHFSLTVNTSLVNASNACFVFGNSKSLHPCSCLETLHCIHLLFNIVALVHSVLVIVPQLTESFKSAVKLLVKNKSHSWQFLIKELNSKVHWWPQMPHTFSTASTVCCPQVADSDHCQSGQRELDLALCQPQFDC